MTESLGSHPLPSSDATPPPRKRGRPRKHGLRAAPGPIVPPVEPLVDAARIADLLSIPHDYVYDLAKREEIPVIRVGKYLRFSIQAVFHALGHQAPGDRPV